MYQLMRRYVCPLAALLYGEQGGDSLDRLHSFVVPSYPYPTPHTYNSLIAGMAGQVQDWRRSRPEGARGRLRSHAKRVPGQILRWYVRVQGEQLTTDHPHTPTLL